MFNTSRSAPNALKALASSCSWKVCKEFRHLARFQSEQTPAGNGGTQAKARFRRAIAIAITALKTTRA
jgi:hypothetical protein